MCAPLGTRVEATASGAPPPRIDHVLPVLVAGLGWVAALWRRRFVVKVSAVVLCVWVVIGVWAGGLFYIPSAASMVVVATRPVAV